MIATAEFYGTTTTTPTGCNRDCLSCTMNCDVVVIYRSPGTVVTTTRERRYASSLDTRLPDPVEKEEYLYVLIDKEEIRLRRKEALRKSRYKNPFNHKPSINRRMQISRSGWLTRKGRLRKKGKK